MASWLERIAILMPSKVGDNTAKTRGTGFILPTRHSVPLAPPCLPGGCG